MKIISQLLLSVLALSISACGQMTANHHTGTTETPQTPSTIFFAALPDCSAEFVRDYYRVYSADADLMNNRIYGNFSAMEDRINLVAVHNACEAFYRAHSTQSCRHQTPEAETQLSTVDLEQICDANRK